MLEVIIYDHNIGINYRYIVKNLAFKSVLGV